MKLIHITAIMAYLVAAALLAPMKDGSFWLVIYGYAGMLAVFALLTLKITWAALFGTVAYTIIAYKLLQKPEPATSLSNVGLISGLIVCAFYCLVLSGHEIRRHNRDKETPENT